MLKRQAAAIVKDKAKQYPIVAITGPRQAGKSTLAKMVFPKKTYCSLEDIDTRQFAMDDPRQFLAQFPDGAILDEIQYCPQLFSYLQTLVDADKRLGLFIITGSQQFNLIEKISQSLAGRVGIIQLLPFSLAELNKGKSLPDSLDDLLFTGSYPPIYDRHIPPNHWHADYVMTYLERDVRQLLNVQDLSNFHRFIKMCAGRSGQLLNLSSLASDCGITHNTAKAWLSVLEASYIIFLLAPHHKNFDKRMTKSPKLYFYDTGLLCFLLGLQQASQLLNHSLRGAIFETWVISEAIKHRYNMGLLSNLYFWRDQHGHEVDLIVEQGNELIPVEIKSGHTINRDYFKGLQFWRNLSQYQAIDYLIYAGNSAQKRHQTHIINWRDLHKLLEQL